VDVSPVEHDSSGIGRVQATGDVQQRGLPRPTATDHGHELPGRDFEIDAVQRDHHLPAARESFGDRVKGEERHKSGRRDTN
jgi:hypothetical protein